ncbi:MAG: chemotaxis protein CheW [Patescibacteria group bacterium]|jgi:purine-binding chemotaxis protein CheW
MTARSEKFILFYIGDEQYALPVLIGNQFIEFENMTLIPKISQKIKGLIYHNGNIVTIIDTKELLNIKILQKNKQLMCLTFEADGYYYGLLVDQGGETLAVNKTFNDRHKKVFSKYFRTKDKKKVYILDIDDILSQINIYD